MPLPTVAAPLRSQPSGPTRRLVRDRAYDAIRTAILQGALRPGERLDAAELQRWLGVSRTPVRQALFALSLEGLVETAPQSHTRVAGANPEEAARYLQAIGVLAEGLAAVTFPEVDDKQCALLSSALGAAIAAIDNLDHDGFIERVTEYWSGLTRLCPNRVLAQLVEQTATAFGYKVVVALDRLPVDWALVRQQHAALLAGVNSGDLDAIEGATRAMFAIRERSH